MKIYFRTESGYLLGQISLLQFATCWVAFLGVAAFVVTSDSNLRGILEQLRGAIGLAPLFKPCPNNSFLIWLRDEFSEHWITGTRIIVAVVPLVIATTRLFRGTWAYAQYCLDKHTFLLSRLRTAKIREELRSYPNHDQESYFIEKLDADRDAEAISEATNKKIITNTKVHKLKWVSPGCQQRFSRIPLEKKERRQALKASIKALKALARKHPSYRLRINISAVQPGALYAATRIIDRQRVSKFIELIKEAKTGPRAIRNATIDIDKDIGTVEKNTLRLFVAPLSAYVMYDPENPETLEKGDPVDKFRAAAVLIKERQDILVVDDGNRVPLRKGRGLYYNNSTAEECWAKSSAATRGLFECVSVDRYGDYLEFLKGSAPQNKKPLAAGDAIVTWPPLTNYYAGRKVGSGHFNMRQSFEISTTSYSRILLFAEDRPDADADLVEMSNLFIEIFLATMLVEREKCAKTTNYMIRAAFLGHWRFGTRFGQTFAKLIQGD